MSRSTRATSPCGPETVISLPRTWTSARGKARSTVRSTSSRAPSRDTMTTSDGTTILCTAWAPAAPEVKPSVWSVMSAGSRPPFARGAGPRNGGPVPLSYRRHPGGHPKGRPASTWPCTWKTDWPVSAPVLKTSRNAPFSPAPAASAAPTSTSSASASRVRRGERGHVAVVVPRDDEGVQRRLGVDVAEGDHPLTDPDDLRRHVTGDDPAEQAPVLRRHRRSSRPLRLMSTPTHAVRSRCDSSVLARDPPQASTGAATRTSSRM